jgi:hypothetical protein
MFCIKKQGVMSFMHFHMNPSFASFLLKGILGLERFHEALILTRPHHVVEIANPQPT